MFDATEHAAYEEAHMQIETFYDPATFTLTYVVYDPKTKDAVIIDPVLEYNPIGSHTDTKSAERYLEFVRSLGLEVHWILETHAHADHLTSAQFLKAKLGASVAIGEGIREVQSTFRPVFGFGPEFATDGSQFDRLLADGETIEAGSLVVKVIATPGHTPACVTYRIDDCIFTGDALFMHDYGTGRCDFPAGSSRDLYRSIQKLYRLPDETRVFVGHDYQPAARGLAYQTTIGKSKAHNPQLNQETSEAAFILARDARDQTLAAPRLLFQSVQVNANAGILPRPNDAGVRLFVLPVNLFTPSDEHGTRRRQNQGQ